MKQFSPKKIKIIEGLPPKTDKDARIALDTEWFNMDADRLHRPHGVFASIACTMDAKTVYIVTDPKQLPAFFERIEDGVHIWQNAKFDITQIRSLVIYPERNRIWDTMLVEQELFSGYYFDFSLKALTRRWLDIYLEKESREEFETQTSMTKEMLEYAAIDVVATWHVYQAQKAYTDKEYLQIWKYIDRGALWDVLDMDGMMVNQDMWRKLAKEQQKNADKISNKYPEINLRSPQQVLKELKHQKYRKIKDTGEKTLEKLTDCEFAKDVLAFRKFSKSVSTYGEAFLEAVDSNGRIHADFKLNGAATGRLSCSKPNLENIPKDKRFRACFIAGHGNILVDADWSSQEPRIAAFLSQDEQMINIFRNKQDIYIEAARLMFGWELTKKDPRRNSRMKPTVLGACYGLTEFGMEIQYNIPKDEGKELLDAFFGVFTGLKEWIDEQQSGKEYVTTIYGRKYYLNPYLDKSNRNAINSPVQGSAGDGIKIASHKFRNMVKQEFDPVLDYVAVVNYVHDEILVECQEDAKDRVMKMLESAMISTAEEMHPGIPAEVEIHCGKTWAEAHG